MYQISADLVNRELRNATFEGKKHQTQTHRSHAWLCRLIDLFIFLIWHLSNSIWNTLNPVVPLIKSHAIGMACQLHMTICYCYVFSIVVAGGNRKHPSDGDILELFSPWTRAVIYRLPDNRDIARYFVLQYRGWMNDFEGHIMNANVVANFLHCWWYGTY